MRSFVQVICLAATIPLAAIQDSERDSAYSQILATRTRTTVSILLTGKTFVTEEACAEVVDPLGEYKLVRLASVRKALKIESTENAKIDGVVEKADTLMAGVMAKVLAPSKNPSGDVAAWYRDGQRSVGESLEAILTKSQKNKLSQLNNRFQMFRMGLYGFLREKQRLQEIDWELSQGELQNIREVALRIRESIREKAKEFHQQKIDEFLDILRDEQAKSLLEVAGSCLRATGEIDLLSAQLAEGKFVHRGQGKGKNVLEQMGIPALYFVGLDGQLYRHLRYDSWIRPVDAIGLAWIGDIVHSLVDGDLGVRLKVSDVQRLELQEILHSLLTTKMRTQKYIEEASNIFVGIVGAEFVKDGAKKKHERRILEILTKRQIDELELVVSIADIARFGLASQLANGEVGKRLKITRGQKTRLKRVSHEIVDEISSVSQGYETEVIDQLMLQLSGRHRRELNRLIGKPIDESSTSVSLLIGWLGSLQEGK